MKAASLHDGRFLDPDDLRRLFFEQVGVAASALLTSTSPAFHQRDAAPALGLEAAAMVGFLAKRFGGAYVLGVKGPEARRPGLHDDWVGELANQLSGRVKNKLVSLGIEPYQVSPQVTIRGGELAVAQQLADAALVYSSAGGECQVWISLSVYGRIFVAAPNDHERPPSEGEVLLF